MQYKSWLNLQKELNLKINAVVNLHFPQMQMSYWWKPAASPPPPPIPLQYKPTQRLSFMVEVSLVA